MKKTFCEKLIWHAMTPTIWKYLKNEFLNLNLIDIKKQQKKIIISFYLEHQIQVILKKIHLEFVYQQEQCGLLFIMLLMNLNTI